jgi:hypothetical protein
MNKFYKLIIFVLGLLWLGACEENNETPTPQFSDEVIIVNEGNFQAANGSLSTYNKETEQATLQQFEPQTTIQGAIFHQNSLYLVGNAPDEVEIVDIEDYSTITSISSGFLNPISFAAVNNTAFVSNWGDINTAFGETPDSFISVVDLTSNTVIDSVDLEYRPQNLISLDGFIYIAYEGSDVVGKLDPATLAIEELTVPFGPSTFVVDGNNNLWVLTASGSLVEILTTNFSVGNSIDNLSVSGFDEKMDINVQDNIIYFLSSDAAYQIDLNQSTLTAQLFTDEDLDYYGIGVDPASGDVYIGDSNGFTSTGTGFRYSKDGTLIDDFPTGIGPNDFLFN